MQTHHSLAWWNEYWVTVGGLRLKLAYMTYLIRHDEIGYLVGKKNISEQGCCMDMHIESAKKRQARQTACKTQPGALNKMHVSTPA